MRPRALRPASTPRTRTQGKRRFHRPQPRAPPLWQASRMAARINIDPVPVALRLWQRTRSDDRTNPDAQTGPKASRQDEAPGGAPKAPAPRDGRHIRGGGQHACRRTCRPALSISPGPSDHLQTKYLRRGGISGKNLQVFFAARYANFAPGYGRLAGVRLSQQL